MKGNWRLTWTNIIQSCVKFVTVNSNGTNAAFAIMGIMTATTKTRCGTTPVIGLDALSVAEVAAGWNAQTPNTIGS